MPTHQGLLTFNVVTKEDLTLEIIKNDIKSLKAENLALGKAQREKLLDFYESRMNRKGYLGRYGFDDVDMPLMTLELTRKVINKTSLLYKTAPERTTVKDDTEETAYNELMGEGDGFKKFNHSLKTAERYKNLLHIILYMPLFTVNGWRFYIHTEWVPYFSKTDSLNPIAYSIPLLNNENDIEQTEQVWLFVSDEFWFLHDENGDKQRPDPSFPAAEDMTNPIGKMPLVELRKDVPVTSYWPEGAIGLAEANQSINMSINDLFGLIHYQTFSEKFISGVSPEEVGKVKNPTTGAWEGNDIKSGFNKIHMGSDPDADMSIITPSPLISEVEAAIQKVLAWVSTMYNVNVKFEVTGTPPSGFSLLVENIDLLEAREDDIDHAEMAEHEIYNIIEAQSSIVEGLNNITKLDKDTVLTIDFREGIDFPINQKEEIQRLEFEFKHNISTPLDVMQSNDPELDREQLQKKLDDNRAINIALTPRQQAINTVFEEEDEDETQT